MAEQAAPTWDTNELFPERNDGLDRGPLRKQRIVLALIFQEIAQDGVIVYQGGKGCAKTITGAGTDIIAHLTYPGLLSVIGRENYPAHLTSTWPDYEKMLKCLPGGGDKILKKVKAPEANSMGYVEWENSGITRLISLSKSDTWESANIGLAWVDEAHRQREEIVADLLNSRIRQAGMPRVLLLTTNPSGRGWIYQFGHPQSKSPNKADPAFWVESNMYENPYLPPGYVRRMEARYPEGTPGRKRWILGMSTALEGAVFAELFDSDPDAKVHVVPPFRIPDAWPRGRGLDWGIDHPTVCLWGARDDMGNIWFYRGHQDRMKSARWHGERIMEKQGDEIVKWTPADPSIWSTHSDRQGLTTVAQEFWKAGCRWTQANNDREAGLSAMIDIIRLHDDRIHPVTLIQPAPMMFIQNTPSLDPLVDSLEKVQWKKEPSTGSSASPDDIAKKDDDPYDAARYLIMEILGLTHKDPVRHRDRVKRTDRGTRDYRGY